MNKLKIYVDCHDTIYNLPSFEEDPKFYMGADNIFETIEFWENTKCSSAFVNCFIKYFETFEWHFTFHGSYKAIMCCGDWLQKQIPEDLWGQVSFIGIRTDLDLPRALILTEGVQVSATTSQLVKSCSQVKVLFQKIPLVTTDSEGYEFDISYPDYGSLYFVYQWNDVSDILETLATHPEFYW